MNTLAEYQQNALLRRLASVVLAALLVKGTLWLAAPLVFLLFV